MMKVLVLLALTFAASAAAQTDSPWLNWVAQNSPYGFDITPGGDIWISLAEPGQTDDYAILADDLNNAREEAAASHEFWVRGYHRRNPRVSYRESKTLFRINCGDKTINQVDGATYDADGRVDQDIRSTFPSRIIPGTLGAEFYRLVCLVD